MMRLTYLLAVCLLPSAISALPSLYPSEPVGYVSIPFSKKSRGITDVLRPRAQPFDAALHNKRMGYTIDVYVGAPPQLFTLLLDTGSSDLWVFSPSCTSCAGNTGKYFDTSKSHTFRKLDDLGDFGLLYGDGTSVSGYYASDYFGVKNGNVSQTFGITTKVQGGDWDDGIFGIGLDQAESLVGKKHKTYPGYLTSLKQKGLIGASAYSLFLNSRTADDTARGLIIFGGYDSKKWTGNLVYFPMIERAPDGHYRLDVLEPTITYDLGSGQKKVDGGSKDYTVFFDTGSSYCYIPSKQFDVISKAIGAQKIGKSDSYSVDCSLAGKPAGINFRFEGPNGAVTVVVPWAEMVLADDSLPKGRCALGMVPSSKGDADGTYILGDTFIRSAYLIFDYDSLKIGIAQVNFDHQKRSQIMTL